MRHFIHKNVRNYSTSDISQKTKTFNTADETVKYSPIQCAPTFCEFIHLKKKKQYSYSVFRKAGNNTACKSCQFCTALTVTSEQRASCTHCSLLIIHQTPNYILLCTSLYFLTLLLDVPFSFWNVSALLTFPLVLVDHHLNR